MVELWNIGDVVLTLPFLTQLRALFPHASITLLARPHARELLFGTGLVDEFIDCNLAWRDEPVRHNPFRYPWAELRRVGGELRKRRFDILFQSRLHLREHFLAVLSGATRTVGYAFRGDRHVLTDAIWVDDASRHKVDDWMGLLAPFGRRAEVEAPGLKVSESEGAWAEEYLAGNGVGRSEVLIGIHPGASLREKRWPLESFREATTALAARAGIRVVVFAEPDGYGSSLGDVPGVIVAKVELRQLMAVISRCRLLVCNDSGPMHIAGALAVPTVAVFAAGIDRMFSPLGSGHVLLPAGPRGISTISPSQVLAAVDRLLDEKRQTLADRGDESSKTG